MLRGIPSTSSYFIQSQRLLADILLTHKRDKQGYIRCYEHIAQQSESVKSHLLLADAYVYIQETRKAIAEYEIALQLSGNDSNLVLKFVKALIACHEYQRAIFQLEVWEKKHTFFLMILCVAFVCFNCAFAQLFFFQQK